MIGDLLHQQIIENFHSLKISRKGWCTSNCPMCIHRGHSADTRGRFGIKFADANETIGMNCFNCGFHSKWTRGSTISNNFVDFLAALHIPEDTIRQLKFQAYMEKQAGDLFVSKPLPSKITHKWTQIELPKSSFPISFWKENNCNDSDFIRAEQYVSSRKLHNTDELYWTPEKSKMECKRFIIPCYYNDVIVGYSARLTNNTTNKKIPKYINVMPDSYIYNMDSQKNRKYTILCEGIIDALLVDGISCIGNSINSDQISLINQLSSDIIVCPDRDKDGQALIDIAIEQGWYVSMPKWDTGIKDATDAVNKYGRLLTVKTILDAKESNPLKIHVIRKFDMYGDNYKE